MTLTASVVASYASHTEKPRSPIMTLLCRFLHRHMHSSSNSSTCEQEEAFNAACLHLSRCFVVSEPPSPKIAPAQRALQSRSSRYRPVFAKVPVRTSGCTYTLGGVWRPSAQTSVAQQTFSPFAPLTPPTSCRSKTRAFAVTSKVYFR